MYHISWKTADRRQFAVLENSASVYTEKLIFICLSILYRTTKAASVHIKWGATAFSSGWKKDPDTPKTIKVATRSARLSRHVTQECTANFQWRRKSSQNVNKDFLVVRFGNITKDFISWRRCAKMKIRYYESIRPKKSEKISLFDFQNKKNVQVRTYSRKYLDPVKLFGVQNTLFHLCTSTVI